MPKFAFDTKLTRQVAEEMNKDLIKLLEQIAPSPIPIDTEITKKTIIDDVIAGVTVTKNIAIANNYYCKYSVELADKALYFKYGSSNTLISYIIKNIGYLTNYIIITENDFCNNSEYKRSSFYEAINELIENKVIYLTNKRSGYVVNHNYLFKGDLSKFADAYKRKYPDGAKLDEKGRIIIEK